MYSNGDTGSSSPGMKGSEQSGSAARASDSGTLSLDVDRLIAFEDQFDPANPAESGAHILGYGKFSTVFEIKALDGLALKRLPPFPTAAERALHERSLNAYHMILRRSVDLNVVDQRCVPITNRHGEHVLYIVQARQPYRSIGDRVLKHGTDAEALRVLGAVLENTLRVWHRNEIEKELEVPGSLTGLDAGFSNWSITFSEEGVARAVYLDTTTPFFRRLGKDRLEPDLFLDSVPGPLTGFVRQHFVGDVLKRYYDLRCVLIDLLADFLVFEQESRLPVALDTVNHFLETDAADLYIAPIESAEVLRHARKDHRFWKRFLALSRLKRFGTTRLLRRKYNFSLPV